MKFGFYVSGSATRLCNFIEDGRGRSKIGFILIDCKNNKSLRTLCHRYNIPLFEYSYKEEGLKGKEQNEFISTRFMQLMDEYRTPYSFINGSRILQGKLLDKYAWKLINFHPAILPAFKGTNAIDAALEAGALLTGNTAHFIDAQLDAGRMIMQSLYPAHKFSDYDAVLNMQLPMMLSIMKWLEEDRIYFKGSRVIVSGADYSIGEYIPNIEI